MADRRVIITGGEGRLAKELIAAIPGARGLGRHLLDVTEPGDFTDADIFCRGDIVIHCAAVLAVEAERDRLKAWAVNVEGTRNVYRAAAQRECRLVFISSDYVFHGDILRREGYREDDNPKPINFYGFTKRRGELIALESPNNLVLRAPFRYGPPWIYENAFVDQWTSARWIGEVAADIALAALSDLTGVLHVGGSRRNLHEMAESAGRPLRKAYRKDWPGLNIPMDTSLDSSRWQQWKAAQAVGELAAK